MNEGARGAATDLDERTTSVAIADVRCRVFRAPNRDGVAMSFGAMSHRVMFVVEVELEDGTVGRGESWVNYPGWAWRERLATVVHGVRPLVLDRELSHPAEVYDSLVRRLDPLGRQWGAPGPIRQAVSGLDAAVWDAVSRRLGRPIADLLGGRQREAIEAYGSSLGPADVVAGAEHCGELGLRAVKVKVGFGREQDLSAIRQVRAVLGDGVQLFADANQAWSIGEAVEMARALRDEGVQWLEEPVAGDELADLESVCAAGMPVATGENLYGRATFERYAASGAVAILQPDVTKCGGITEYAAIAESVQAHGVTVNPHVYNGAIGVAATVQVAASVGSTRLVEWDVRGNPLRRPVDALLGADGAVHVPTEPGLGVDLDLDELADFEEEL